MPTETLSSFSKSGMCPGRLCKSPQNILGENSILGIKYGNSNMEKPLKTGMIFSNMHIKEIKQFR